MTIIDVKPLFDWIHLHPGASGLIIFTICFLECFLLIGVIIPGTVLMTALGTLIGMGTLPFISSILWAITGAIAGDGISFWIGRHYHQRIGNIWPFRTHPQILQRGEAFFKKHGGKSIFIGRFIGPIRPILPLIAGMVFMPLRRFFSADITSAILWAPVYMLPGFIIGHASQKLPPDVAPKLMILLILILVFCALVFSLSRSFYFGISNLLEKKVAILWRFSHSHPRLKNLARLLVTETKEGHKQLAYVLLALIFLTLFILLTCGIAVHADFISRWNHFLYYFFESVRVASLEKFFVFITLLNPTDLYAMWGAVLFLLFYKKNKTAAIHWLILGVLTYVSGEFFKYLLHSPRPTGLSLSPSGWSYPSGHALTSFTFLTFLLVLVNDSLSYSWRCVLRTLVILLISLIVISRVYLEAHWLSDVVGSIFLATFFVFSITLLYRRKKVCKLQSGSILSTAFLALSIAWGASVFLSYNSSVQNYKFYQPIQTISLKKWWNQAGQEKPLYRTNRFGQFVELINLEWASPLADIHQKLTEKNWKTIPTSKFLIKLYNVTTRNADTEEFIFSQTNGGKKTALIMTKTFLPSHQRLILYIWQTTRQTDDKIPIWVGVVKYYKPWQLRFNSFDERQFNSPISPLILLRNDLNDFTTKTVAYIPQSSVVLFVKPNLPPSLHPN